jgi:hypothetical protein
MTRKPERGSAKDKLETVKQCKSCPWRVDCVPEKDIPNGYCANMHAELHGTIKSGLESLPRPGGVIRAMACHYSKPGEEFVCAGWLENQLGPGNNIAARLKVMTGAWPVPEIDGEQHERFEDTLPKTSTRAPKRTRRPRQPRRSR